MSPRAKNFNAGSIIYFEGDKAESVYLLKEGKVNLVYSDVSTMEKITDLISTGEFFGVKSGLIRYPREETAKVLDSSTLYEFSAQEFESLVMKNPKIILKMLKVFSNQLRKVGKQIQTLVSDKAPSDAADDFFQIGEYYLKNKKYKSALTVYQRYLNYYPNGKFAKTAMERLKIAKNAFNMYGDEGGPAPILNENKNAPLSDQNKTMDLSSDFYQEKSDETDFSNKSFSEEETAEDEDENEFKDFSESSDFNTDNSDFSSVNAVFNENDTDDPNSEEYKIYYKGISFMNTGKHLDAFNTFKKILSMKNEKVKVLASYEIGKCFFFMEKFKECIEHLTKFLSLHPSFDEKNDVLYFIGISYSKSGDRSKADRIFKGILSKTKENDPINRKTKRALKELG